METAVKKVQDWKAHIMRTAHQQVAKTTALDEMTMTQVLIVMDWAMKFLPVCFRETQSEWFGKKGRPWHVSAVITKSEQGEFEVLYMNLLRQEATNKEMRHLESSLNKLS